MILSASGEVEPGLQLKNAEFRGVNSQQLRGSKFEIQGALLCEM
jgi:hypothetical protein